MNIPLKYKMSFIAVLILCALTYASIRLYNHFKFRLTAKFETSGPLYENMPVFFKGYRIGRINKVFLSKDYKNTYISMLLYPKSPMIPKETEAVVKNHDLFKNYIDLVVMEGASSTLLKSGEIIDGKPLFEVETFLSEIADSGLIIPLLQNFSDTALSLNKTSVEIKNFFSDSRSIINDNRQNIKQSISEFSIASKSLKTITSRFNNSITDDKLNNTSSNVDKASSNILSASESVKNITASVDCATRTLDKTMAKLDCTLSQANSVLSNVKVITSGLCQTLGKRFAGLRIIFGKPLNKNKCPKNCYN